jgi:negative regulator of flagellin synthesis FlgM
MRINDKSQAAPVELHRREETNAPAAAASTGSAAAARPATSVELSPRSRELHAALDAARQAPDVREDVVRDLRQRVQDGTYQVDPERIARRMIDRRA